jgi:hypothetical protein
LYVVQAIPAEKDALQFPRVDTLEYDLGREERLFPTVGFLLHNVCVCIYMFVCVRTRQLPNAISALLIIEDQ